MVDDWGVVRITGAGEAVLASGVLGPEELEEPVPRQR
jgi:hypothetical protein